MNKKPKIVVVGSFIADIAAFIPRFPTDGESVLGKHIKFGPGGKGSNQATASKRAGGDVVMITKIGNDFLSSVLYDHYKNEQMTTDYVYVTDENETGSAIIEINEQSGENRIIVVKGANAHLTKDEVYNARDEFSSCDMVLLQLESSIEAVEEAISLAKENNKTIILNPAPLQKVPDGLFKDVDYITPNETEAEYFSGVPVKNVDNAREAAEILLKTGAKNIIITMGKSGALLKNKDTEVVVETTNLKAVDTTGAGDAFNGGLAVAISEGMDIIKAIKFANCVASISVTRKGSSKVMPYRHEIDKLYSEYYKI